MSQFEVATTDGSKREIEAEYHVVDEDFLVFKTREHKQVATFNRAFVISAVRIAGKATEVGTVTVKVVPELDEPAFATLLAHAAKRAGANLS